MTQIERLSVLWDGVVDGWSLASFHPPLADDHRLKSWCNQCLLSQAVPDSISTVSLVTSEPVTLGTMKFSGFLIKRGTRDPRGIYWKPYIFPLVLPSARRLRTYSESYRQ
uniref:Uncharacterized protein n=1 Tax=Phytophthora infestans TaxID=4787 RepID=Q572G1_PHYIN|nr:hypothetical protein PI49.0220 [Phytophthora infestans]